MCFSLPDRESASTLEVRDCFSCEFIEFFLLFVDDAWRDKRITQNAIWNIFFIYLQPNRHFSVGFLSLEASYIYNNRKLESNSFHLHDFVESAACQLLKIGGVLEIGGVLV